MAVVLLAGGSAVAQTADHTTTSAHASTIDGAAVERAAAAARADRSRATAADASERARWTAKTVAAQKKLAGSLGASVVQSTEVKLSARTIAANKRKAAAKRAAAARAAIKYVLPVTSGVKQDTFGMTGAHWANRHTGQDFPVPMGTSVRSVGAGTVTETGWAGPYGNRIKILLDDGTEIWYCHLSSYVVTSGHVAAGQVVALSGSTGNSTGPHLHMEVHLHQDPVASDPLNWLRSKGLKV